MKKPLNTRRISHAVLLLAAFGAHTAFASDRLLVAENGSQRLIEHSRAQPRASTQRLAENGSEQLIDRNRARLEETTPRLAENGSAQISDHRRA